MTTAALSGARRARADLAERIVLMQAQLVAYDRAILILADIEKPKRKPRLISVAEQLPIAAGITVKEMKWQR